MLHLLRRSSSSPSFSFPAFGIGRSRLYVPPRHSPLHANKGGYATSPQGRNNTRNALLRRAGRGSETQNSNVRNAAAGISLPQVTMHHVVTPVPQYIHEHLHHHEYHHHSNTIYYCRSEGAVNVSMVSIRYRLQPRSTPGNHHRHAEHHVHHAA
jgi:hypothetical protein